MDFCNVLANYMNMLDCTAKKICDVSNLSPTLICRYLGGKRTPKAKSIYVEKIADALEKIAFEKNISLSKKDIVIKFNTALQSTNVVFNALAENLSQLQEKLGISTIDLSKSIGYDPSFISRIKNRERRPADINNFIKTLSDYTENIGNDEKKKTQIYALIGYNQTSLQKKCSSFETAFHNWITTPKK